MSNEKEYILGTHDEEISRLGLQHSVWRPRALDAWRRAGITVGQTVLDLGCGPGYASLDLAEIVGPEGKVVAIDRSRRFLDALESRSSHRGFSNIETHELDLNHASLPQIQADAAWTRWVFAFVKDPRQLLERAGATLKKGATWVIHEYIDYASWRMMPRSDELEEFVRVVMKSWRHDGGEPDIGLELPGWLNELGFELQSLNPIMEVISPANYMWQWPMSFARVGLKRMADLGYLDPKRAHQIEQSLKQRESEPNTRMVTPAVLEIIAVRKSG